MTRLSRLALNEEGFAFDPVTGESYLLNETALFVLRALRDGRAAAEIAETMSRTYEVSEADAERDVSDLVERLTSFGLLGGSQ